MEGKKRNHASPIIHRRNHGQCKLDVRLKALKHESITILSINVNGKEEIKRKKRKKTIPVTGCECRPAVTSALFTGVSRSILRFEEST
jgi:hypothetical protein